MREAQHSVCVGRYWRWTFLESPHAKCRWSRAQDEHHLKVRLWGGFPDLDVLNLPPLGVS